MSTAVEILVTDDSAKRALARALRVEGPGVSFRTTPSAGSASRLFISWLAALDSREGRARVEQVLSEASACSTKLPVIFIAAGPSKHAKFSAAAAQALAVFSGWAGRSKLDPYVAPDAAAARRIVQAQRAGATRELVASASLEADKLIVWSCEPRRYEIPVQEIPSLAAMRPDSLAEFEVSPSGSGIRWRAADVDLNLETVLEHVDPEVKRRHEKQARADAARYAKAIRLFRVEMGLKQTGIHGLTDRQVRRIESGDVVPHIDSLRKLAAAHGMDVNQYMKELASRTVRHRRAAVRPGRMRRGGDRAR